MKGKVKRNAPGIVFKEGKPSAVIPDKGRNGEKAFEAYAQQRTPSAYRVFWFYG